MHAHRDVKKLGLGLKFNLIPQTQIIIIEIGNKLPRVTASL